MKELEDISKQLNGLQTETELVANMDRIDSAWKALDDGISFWWTGLITQHQAKGLKTDGDALHAEWKRIFTDWKPRRTRNRTRRNWPSTATTTAGSDLAGRRRTSSSARRSRR